jgi:hypothetical protein
VRRTALVHILRLLFTIGAVLAAGMAAGHGHREQPAAPKGAEPGATGLSVTVLGPRFDGYDANERPYTPDG